MSEAPVVLEESAIQQQDSTLAGVEAKLVGGLAHIEVLERGGNRYVSQSVIPEVARILFLRNVSKQTHQEGLGLLERSQIRPVLTVAELAAQKHDHSRSQCSELSPTLVPVPCLAIQI